jgi:hypothetical protein
LSGYFAISRSTPQGWRLLCFLPLVSPAVIQLKALRAEEPISKNILSTEMYALQITGKSKSKFQHLKLLISLDSLFNYFAV